VAEGEDQSQKTEDPTQKKLDDARKKGQVATSREINHWFMILAGTLVVVILAPSMMRNIATDMSRFLASAHTFHVDSAGLREIGISLATSAFVALSPAMLLFIAAALGSGLVQNGLVISTEKLEPKLENLSLKKGFDRLFSAKSIVEFVKGILKLAIVAFVAVVLIAPEFDRINATPGLEPSQILDLLWKLTIRMLGGVCAVITVIAGVDFIYQKFEFNKSMRMSKQEVKDEIKQSEGDQMVKARLRQLRVERARKRMMAAVPEADVVITNPSHYAVALKYDPDAMPAPRLVAKGVDTIAQKIKEVAQENDVAIVENPPLARALHASVEIDQEISETHYKAVAEVIGYVWRLKRKSKPRRRR
jgi:flagellar biosynthetic protein FlhB